MSAGAVALAFGAAVAVTAVTATAETGVAGTCMPGRKAVAGTIALPAFVTVPFPASVAPKRSSPAADSMTFDTTSGRLALEPNRPNPFPVSTRIAYSIPADGHVRLTVHDFLYREIQAVVDEQQTAGRYEVVWPNAETTENLSSGMYFCTLTTSAGVQQLRMLLMK